MKSIWRKTEFKGKNKNFRFLIGRLYKITYIVQKISVEKFYSADESIQLKILPVIWSI